MEQELEMLKRSAAVHAADYIEDGMVVGLGTGSTVRYLLEEIGRRRAAGALPRIACVATSDDTGSRAASLDIPLSDLRSHGVLDLTIDGADEVDPQLRLIKGLGGALLREKIVATASRELVVIVDASKCVQRLGTLAPLPVEVDAFGAPIQPPFLDSLGCRPVLRRDDAGNPFVTDGGNRIYDCRFPEGIERPEELQELLDARAGILEHGLFLGLATRVVVASGNGIRTLERES